MTAQQMVTSELWDRLVESHRAYASASQEFLAREDRVEVLRNTLRGKDRGTALPLARSLTEQERQGLFSEWVFLASWVNGAMDLARKMILDLPRDWVLANIEHEVEPYLQTGSYEEFRRFLELYDQLDPGLTQTLAYRAAAHSDPDIREAGEDFLTPQHATSIPKSSS